MRFSIRSKWLLAFAALFAAAAGFVFWGTWSLDSVPVMPDCPTSFPLDYAEDWIRGWNQNGKFVPGDLIAFIGSPYFWVELRYVLAILCAALGMAYFLKGRKVSTSASLGAGLLLAFSGYWLTLFSAGHLGWFQWMTYGVFVFGLIDRSLEKGKLRHWLALGACLAWGSFYQPDLWLLFTVFSLLYFIYRYISLVPKGTVPISTGTVPAKMRGTVPVSTGTVPAKMKGTVPVPPLKWIKGGVVALVTFVIIGIPSFKHAIFSDLASRDKQIENGETISGECKDEASKRWVFVTNWSMPIEDTIEFFDARVHGDTSCPMTLAIGNGRGNGIRPYVGRLGCPIDNENDKIPEGGSYPNYRQHSLYVGWVTCLLAFFAVVATFVGYIQKRSTAYLFSKDIVFILVCGFIFYLFSLGRFCEIVYRLVYNLPMGDYLRAPVKWHHLTEFCIVALAGFGLEYLRRILSAKMGKAVAINIAFCGIVTIGVFDLARNDALYCAPHTADTQVAPITQMPVPTNPVRAKDFYRQVRDAGLKPLGESSMTFNTPQGLQAMNVLWIEQAVPKPRLRDVGKTMDDISFFFAALSALATGLVVGFLVISLFNKRIDGIKLR